MSNYYTNLIDQELVGGTIVNSIIDSNDSNFYGFEVRMPSGEIKNVWILRDEEWNGPGAIEISPDNEEGDEDE